MSLYCWRPDLNFNYCCQETTPLLLELAARGSTCDRFQFAYAYMYSRFDIQGSGPRSGWSGPWGGVSLTALYCARVAQAERTDTECCNHASIVQAKESACTVRILHGILTESVLQVHCLQAVQLPLLYQ